ncbi:helix-turn-helix transcriptional regulator [Parvularcula marina]|uniref:LuxR family transcriptional regulator n=1 Tax=Parvularcula marina TaxID=2292771 RepID=A0A371RI67_9PROT|nr:LuxR family transcriptional regulator [Parvularcula marina]RFB05130.1 LuxR family transcriptional regulator [Parvularcula marina]
MQALKTVAGSHYPTMIRRTDQTVAPTVHRPSWSPASENDNQLPAQDNWLQLGNMRIRVKRSMDDLGLRLSPRERQILLLTAQGEGVKSIARMLDISVHTVDTFRRRIYQKLGVSNAASAAAITLALCLDAEVEIEECD